MLIQLIPRIGGEPITLDVSQFVVYQQNGTPIAVGAEYGPDNSQSLSMVTMPDFNRVLQALGIDRHVVVNRLHAPAPLPDTKKLNL